VNSFRPELTPEVFNGRSAGHLPGLVGLQILTMTPEGVQSRLEVHKALMAPNGFLHAATVIALADTSCGYGCVAHLPQGASGFTTLELKSNFLGTARDGAIACRAWPLHPDGVMAQVGTGGAAIPLAPPIPPGHLRRHHLPMRRRSCFNPHMHRWFFGSFFCFPRHLAEGNG